MTTTIKTLLQASKADPSWHTILDHAMQQMDPVYLDQLLTDSNWLPGTSQLLNAFSLPLSSVNFVLLGESPYPRATSANGYAFWDNAVQDIWSDKGLSKEVNRATSLRNFIKMLLLTGGQLDTTDLTQQAIANLDKTQLIKTLDELFTGMLDRGFLLLNASLVLSDTSVRKDAKQWLPFIRTVLSELYAKQPTVEFLLFGKIAQIIENIPALHDAHKLCTEHPYNISFITNQDVIKFFRPLALLIKGWTKPTKKARMPAAEAQEECY